MPTSMPSKPPHLQFSTLSMSSWGRRTSTRLPSGLGYMIKQRNSFTDRTDVASVLLCYSKSFSSLCSLYPPIVPDPLCPRHIGLRRTIKPQTPPRPLFLLSYICFYVPKYQNIYTTSPYQPDPSQQPNTKMPSNTERRPKIPAQRSSDIYYTQLHLQNPHLYPSSNPYSLPPREDFLSYSPPTNPRPAAPTTRPDHAPPPVQKRSSSPSDAALFWSFVSRQIQKQKAKLRAKKAQATTSSASGPISRPIPIVYPSSTSTLPPPTSPQPHSLFHAYRRQQKEKKARARKALISAPLKGGVTVVRTDSGNEYSFPEPRVEGGVVRVLMGRGGTKKGRGVVMPMASSKVAGLRELEKRASRRMPSGAEVVGLGIDLGDGKLGPRRVKGERITRWGDFLGKSSEERESERRKAKPSAPTAKTAGDTYGGRNERCRICHEMQNPNPKTARSRSSGVCARCKSSPSLPLNKSSVHIANNDPLNRPIRILLPLHPTLLNHRQGLRLRRYPTNPPPQRLPSLHQTLSPPCNPLHHHLHPSRFRLPIRRLRLLL